MITGSTEINTLDQKFPTLTDKYKLVKTSDLIEKLQAQGFKLDKFVANRVRNQSKVGYQKHRAIFSHPELLKSTGDGSPQLLLTNSHDGTSAVVLQLGFFRMVCANGLVAGKSIGEPIRLRHSGKFLYEELDKAVEKIVAQVKTMNEAIDKLKSKVLNENEIKSFQQKALDLRLAPNVELLDSKFNIHRPEDAKADLFTVFNVIQENLVRGGARIIIKEQATSEVKQKTLRKITSIQTETELNTKLWDMAMALAA